MGRTIIISRTVLYRVVFGLCDYLHSENPVCSIIKPKASSKFLTVIVTGCIDFKYIKTKLHYHRCIKILILSPFFPRFFSILALPRELRRLKCETLYTKQRIQHTKHRNQNDITQNTMSHIGFRT